MEDEQLKVSSAPVPFVRWMSSTFALALEQQQNSTSATLSRVVILFNFRIKFNRFSQKGAFYQRIIHHI